MLVYLRDGSARKIVRAATLRQNLQIKLSTSPSHSILLLLLVRQMEIPVSPMKVAVHRRSLRLPYSLRATGVWSGQIPFLSGS